MCVSGPLVAVVDAQAKAAMNTVNFINSVGFTDEGSTKKATMVEFSFDTVNSTTGEVITNKLTVPLLTIIPIPYLRVASCTIDFNAKISSVKKSSINSDTSLSATVSGSYGSKLFSSVSFEASVSSKISTKYSNEEQREFSMAIHIEAVQDEMPAGMAKMLSLLEEAIYRGK